MYCGNPWLIQASVETIPRATWAIFSIGTSTSVVIATYKHNAFTHGLSYSGISGISGLAKERMVGPNPHFMGLKIFTKKIIKLIGRVVRKLFCSEVMWCI